MADIRPERRCGNTTRLVDEWIQEYFDKGTVVIRDHAHPNVLANVHAWKQFRNRLASEHRIFLKQHYSLELQTGTITRK